MTPKEKAKEIFDKMCLAMATEKDEDGYFTNVIHAKKCALISVFQIFEVVTDIETWIYFVEVKKEIEKYEI